MFNSVDALIIRTAISALFAAITLLNGFLGNEGTVGLKSVTASSVPVLLDVSVFVEDET